MNRSTEIAALRSRWQKRIVGATLVVAQQNHCQLTRISWRRYETAKDKSSGYRKEGKWSKVNV